MLYLRQTPPHPFLSPKSPCWRPHAPHWHLTCIRIRLCFLALISARGPLIPMKKYQCVVCGYIYDEALGAPEDGIPAGTKWDDVPDTWLCPDCGVGKSDFEMVEI
jgi:rubredoxin